MPQRSPKGSSVRPTIRIEFCFPPEGPNICMQPIIFSLTTIVRER